EHLDRLEGRLAATRRELEALRPPESAADVFLRIPPSRAEQELISQRDDLEAALARVHFFLDAEDAEWIVRYPPDAAATLELVPLTVAAMVRELFAESAELVVLSSAHLGPKRAVAECFGLDEGDVRAFAGTSPFPVEQRRIVYRPVGALSRTSLAALEPALFAAVALILAEHPAEKGLIHAPSYVAGERLVRDLAARAPAHARRHADDHVVTSVLDAQFERFLTRYRVLLPEWFLDAAEPALRARYSENWTL